MFNFLDGYKTYIGIAAGILYGLLIYFQVVANEELVWGVITAWTGVSVNMAIHKK